MKELLSRELPHGVHVVLCSFGVVFTVGHIVVSRAALGESAPITVWIALFFTAGGLVGALSVWRRDRLVERACRAAADEERDSAP
jgi:hypothetical protein